MHASMNYTKMKALVAMQVSFWAHCSATGIMQKQACLVGASKTLSMYKPISNKGSW